MKLPLPDFIPVPDRQVIQAVSLVLLMVGVGVTLAGVLLLLWNRRKGQQENRLPWILICIGLLLTANHSLQLIF